METARNTLFLSKRTGSSLYPSKCWEEADFYPSSLLPMRETFPHQLRLRPTSGQGSICACCSHTSPQKNLSLWNNFPKQQNREHRAVHPPGILLPKLIPATAAGRQKQKWSAGMRCVEKNTTEIRRRTPTAGLTACARCRVYLGEKKITQQISFSISWQYKDHQNMPEIWKTNKQKHNKRISARLSNPSGITITYWLRLGEDPATTIVLGSNRPKSWIIRDPGLKAVRQQF